MAMDEPQAHEGTTASRLNRLRAGVLGANDGIISTAGLVVGVAASTTDRQVVLMAGIAGLVAGAVSMALGEYVSVSTQRDAEKASLDLERRELREDPEGEIAELAQLYIDRGLRPETARTVAEELTAYDALAAHAEVELGLDPDELTNPWQAAFSSAVAFTIGALIPLLAMVTSPVTWRVPVTVVAVLVALVLTGGTGAHLGGASTARGVARVVGGGALALAVTYAIGRAVGVAV